MREAALAALVAAVDGITVRHQPAQEGFADEIADLFSAPAGDLENGGRRTQGTQSQRRRPRCGQGVSSTLRMPHCRKILDQAFDDRLAGETKLLECSGQCCQPTIVRRAMSPEARQFAARQAVAHRQSGDESGQRRTNEAGLGRPQVAFTAVHSRYQTLGWVRCCFFPARTTHHMIEMQHTSDPQTTWQPLEIQNEMPAVSLVVMPEFERRSTAAAPVRVVVLGTLCRQRLTAPLSLGAWLLAWPARRTDGGVDGLVPAGIP